MTTVFYNNYFTETPDDVKALIYKYTIPDPPPYPPDTKTYDFDIVNIQYMDHLVKYLPTSYVMKKRYNNISNLFQYYIDNFIMRSKPIPYSKKYQFNKLVYDFLDDHSTNEFRQKYKIEKRNGIRISQKYINRRNKHF